MFYWESSAVQLLKELFKRVSKSLGAVTDPLKTSNLLRHFVAHNLVYALINFSYLLITNISGVSTLLYRCDIVYSRCLVAFRTSPWHYVGYCVNQRTLRDCNWNISRLSNNILIAHLVLCFYRAACNADAVLWWDFCPSVRLSVRLSVCLSVCLSDAWFVTKWKKDRSRFLYHTKEHLA